MKIGQYLLKLQRKTKWDVFFETECICFYLTNLRNCTVSLFAGFRWKTSGSRMLERIVFMKRIEDTTKLVARTSCRTCNTGTLNCWCICLHHQCKDKYNVSKPSSIKCHCNELFKPWTICAIGGLFPPWTIIVAVSRQPITSCMDINYSAKPVYCLALPIETT